MARRVVSLLRSAPGALRATDPALEANAYAVAEDVDLTVVLRGEAVELALAGGEVRPAHLAGVALPPAAGAHDLRGLVESGIRVLVERTSLTDRGIPEADVVAGVEVVGDEQIVTVLSAAEGVLTW
jgi:intracellular sulfur oxidation DsrE/DsrF family protein